MTSELLSLFGLVSEYEPLSPQSLVTTLLVALLCGLIIYVLYRFFYRGVLYSENFAVLIVMVSGTSAFIIIIIGANLVLTLGMVGALSIVRFRAAIKEPLDVGFLFLAVAAGIAAGARLYAVALIGVLVIGLVYVALSYLRLNKRKYLMILRYQLNADKQVKEILSDMRHRLKNKTVAANVVELTVEVSVWRGKTEFMDKFTSTDFVSSASLVEYSGDFA